jgi:hypothetical protein
LKYIGYALIIGAIIQLALPRDLFAYSGILVTSFAIAGVFCVLADLVEISSDYYYLLDYTNNRKQGYNQLLQKFKEFQQTNPGVYLSRQYRDLKYDIDKIPWRICICGKHKDGLKIILYTLALISVVGLIGVTWFDEKLKNPTVSAKINDFTVLISIGVTLVIFGFKKQGFTLDEKYSAETDKIIWASSEMEKKMGI